MVTKRPHAKRWKYWCGCPGHMIKEWAGVNQQPPMHQLRMRPLKPFRGWTKITSSLPKVIVFFRLFSAPKIFPPTYLTPTYLPLPIYVSPLLPSHLPPPSYLPPTSYLSFHRQTPGVVGTGAKREWELNGSNAELRSTWSGT